MEYKPTIGLEIHAELKTKTKMFCKCKNDPDEKKPNINICPVCMAHPGTLPVINKEAVKKVLKVGRSLDSKLADFTEFDRKNYFYPDIPKGYQISQYKYPLVSGGSLKGVTITRVHLEEDTARSQHGDEGGSLVDFNRAGLPLMELVTEAEVRDAKHAGEFARELQLLLRCLDVSDANMEKGQMRVEANISVSKTEDWGTKVEVKNINSFKAVERAIDHEIKRQAEVLDSGGEIVQETRGWDEKKQQTFSQRKKENSDDYRYFPDPDLPKIKISEIDGLDSKTLDAEIPELPWDKRERYKKYFGIKDEDIEIYIRNKNYSNIFEQIAKELEGDKDLVRIASNYLTTDVVGKFGGIFGTDRIPKWFTEQDSAVNFAKLIKMVSDGKVSSRGVKDVLIIMLERGGNPEEIAEMENLLQKNNEEELEGVVDSIIKENMSVMEEYKNGKESALQFLVGQGMKITKGSANPQLLKKILESK